MDEIAKNIGSTSKEHERFRNECILAQKLGTKLIVLVENTDGIFHISQVAAWKNPRRKFAESAVDGDRLYKAMVTMQNKYGVRFMFCRPEDSARLIVELLKRGEALERPNE